MSEPNTADRLNREQLAMQAVEEALLQPEPEQRHWLAAQVMAPPIKQRALDLYDQLSGDDPSADLSKQLLQDAVELTGTTVGDYHLDRLLGRGGMGSVYLAHREHEGVRQQVALKVLNHGLAPINAQRFRIEQQALARLHHPYIAGFVDVGTSASGLNYFAMEYVEGQELCTYADEQNLSLNARIHLWLKLCDAVRSSHQKLIIHRDIKPSNVLVTDDGVPKLVDFGVAKIMEGSEPSMTAALGAQLTLDYASPERIMHGETSTAEDQYALAVLLYELLAGHRPFIRSAHNMTQLLRQVADEDARPMSETFLAQDAVDRRQIAARRGISEKGLRRTLDSDLQAILSRALSSDAAQRYTSIDAMTADLERYLNGEPVSARPASVLYRVRRFVGRHKAGVLATATVALVLVISLFIVVEQVNESQRQLARANAVAKFMSDILKAPSNRWSSTFRIGVDATMQETLLAAAASLQQDSELPVATRVELLVALSESLSIWGLRDQAVQFAREATEMADAGLAPSHPMRELSYINMSIVSNIRGSPESLAEAPRFAQASIEWLQKYDPTNYARLASSVGDLGYNKSQLGEHAQAIVFYEQGFEYWEASGGPDVHPLRALALGLLGYSAFEVGDYDKAYTALDGSFEVYEALGGSPIAEWTITYPYLALLNMAMGRYASAEHVMLRGIEMSDRDGSDDAQKYRSLALYGLMFRQLNRAALVRAVEQRMTQAPARVNEDVLFVLCRQLSQAMDLIERGESAQAFSLLSELADQGVDQAPWYLYVSHLTLLRPLVNASDERSLIEDTLRQLIAEHRLQDAFFTRHFRRADS